MTAVPADGGQYRYTLKRAIPGGNGQAVLFVMLNPSTADANVDDPTIRRCIGFARAWGYSRLLVGNLSAYRATKPADMLGQPCGPLCNHHLLAMAKRADLIVCAWGSNAKGMTLRAGDVRTMLSPNGERPLHHLGLTKGGHPKHPLYLRADTQPIRWITPQAVMESDSGASTTRAGGAQ